MSSNSRDVKEYLKYTRDGITGYTTRGIVVSNVDPLFSGRVKVWIPRLHGGFDEPDGKDPLLITKKQTIGGKVEVVVLAGSAASMTPESIASLPWAQVLGHNWGSVGAFSKTGIGNIPTINYGLFSTPRIGTEVILIFENDDPNFPIVIGSCIHKNDYLWNRKLSLELIPGLRSSVVEPKVDGDYPNEVANSYIIQAANGAKLMLSDSTNREAILLSAPISTVPKEDKKDRNMLKDQSIDYKLILDAYPGFPSTASSPYVSTPTGSITFVNGSVQSSASLFDPTSTIPQQSTLGTTPSDGSTPVTPPPATPPDERVEKTWPVNGTPTDPTDSQIFGAVRAYEKHTGIDLIEPLGAPLLAPVDGVVLYTYFTTEAGNILGMKGKDGSIHQFDNLQSVDSSKIGKSVKIREQLGTCGNTGSEEGIGSHLHWDLVLDPTNLVQTAAEAREFRQAHILGGAFKGSVISEFSFTNPLDWIKTNSVTTLSSDQLLAVVATTKAQDTFNNTTGNEKYRNMGLEMSLVTGRETIFLRHPSGSFLGFDVDGNFMLHTTGDANFKVGRSANWNVFGGFLVDCQTLWHKVSTVARLYAMSFLHSKHIKDSDVAGADIPEFFKRNLVFKTADMGNALASCQSNTWLVDNKTGTSIGTLGEATGSTPPSGPGPITGGGTSVGSTDKLVWGARFSETLGKCTYVDFKQKVISVSTSLGIDPNWLMAVMMAESNLNPSIRNSSSGAVGLIQFTNVALAQMKETKSKETIALMDAVSQMDLVETYFVASGASGRMHSVEDVYAIVFWPAALGKPTDYVIATKPSKAYDQNAGLDLNKNGIITRGELTQRATNYLANGKNYAA